MRYIILFLLVPFAVQSQYSAYKIGVKAGANYSDINNGTDPLLGVHIGAFGYGVVNNNLQIGYEMFYSLQGAKVPVTSAESIKLKSNLFNLNLIGRYFPVPDKFNVHTGIQLGFMMKQKVGDIKLTEPSKSQDISLLFGVGYLISDLEIGLRYSHGLAEVENRVLQLSLAYTIFKL